LLVIPTVYVWLCEEGLQPSTELPRPRVQHLNTGSREHKMFGELRLGLCEPFDSRPRLASAAPRHPSGDCRDPLLAIG
jgi:hypothetical protein